MTTPSRNHPACPRRPGRTVVLFLLLPAAFSSAPAVADPPAAGTSAGAGSGAAAAGAAAAAAAAADADAATGRGRGLVLRLAPADRGGGAAAIADARVERQVALYVPAGLEPSPLVPAGRFDAGWEGELVLEKRSRLYFHFEGRGRASLTIGGEKVVEAEGDDLSGARSGRLRLNRGTHPVRVDYRSPAGGAAVLRLFWEGREFAPEPVPPSAFSYDPGADGLAAAQRLRRGRELFAGARCHRCHRLPAAAGGEGAMPELAADAPDLTGVGDRLQAGWIAAWLLDPPGHRTGAQMPQLLGGGPGAVARAGDIAAFLSTLKTPAEKEAAAGGVDRKPADGLAGASREAGALLFSRLGCVACHRLNPGEEEAADRGRFSLASVGAKYRPGQLAAFLLRPDRHFAWTRMPDFGLDAGEAAALAVFLRGLPAEAKGVPAIAPAAGDSARGRALVGSLGCVNCHRVPGVEKRLVAPSFAHLAAAGAGAGCLSPGAPADPGRAHYPGLTASDLEALGAVLRAGAGHLGRRSLAEFAGRQIEGLNCLACHRRDGRGGRLAELRAAAAHLHPASPAAGGAPAAGAAETAPVHGVPGLDFAGEKLAATWVEDLLAGRLDYRPRPWLEGRMPAFRARAAPLAAGLSLAHGLPPDPAPAAPAGEAERALGRRLAGTEGGFACVACHAVGATPALAPFEGQGVNFAYSARRLRPGFYHRWMLDPLRYQPGTIMPKYADREGVTGLAEPFGGDARRQFGAIWDYLRSFPPQP